MKRKRKYSTELSRLTAAFIKNAKPGYHHDGGGLYLAVSASAAKSWVFVYTRHGKQREMGLGALANFSLKEARERARKCRQLLTDGGDPLAEKRKHHLAQVLASARSCTFAQAAEDYIESQTANWKQPADQARDWRTSIRHATPIIGALPISAIDTTLVVECLKPLWNSKPAAARKLRYRLEAVLSAARVRGLRDGPNPAAWRGTLSHIFPSLERIRAVKHHAAISLDEIPTVMGKLRALGTTAAKATELLTLCAVRTTQLRNMRWQEVDLDNRLWSSPPQHTKSRKGETRPHRVPLSDRAIEILKTMPVGDKVFDGLSETAMRDVLRGLHPFGTPHGMRSAFKDWCRKHPKFPDELSEIALAHSVGDATRQAYARADMVEERQPLMQAWAAYCASTPAEKVTPLPRLAAPTQ